MYRIEVPDTVAEAVDKYGEERVMRALLRGVRNYAASWAMQRRKQGATPRQIQKALDSDEYNPLAMRTKGIPIARSARWKLYQDLRAEFGADVPDE